MSIRDANVIVIETSRTVVRAVLGIYELLKTPSVEISARVGLRRIALLENPQGVSNETRAGEEAGCSASGNATTSAHSAPAVKDYLVGTQLDEALAAGQNISISWPFSNGDVQDWTQAEAIWKYVLFNQLQRRRVQNESPVILSLPTGLPRDTYERVCQIFFERFNVAAFAILERPTAQIYATNCLTGVVVDIGDDNTDITPIYEGSVYHCGRMSTALGIVDCQNYLARLLRSNQSIISMFSSEEISLNSDNSHSILLDLVQKLWEEGHIRVPSDGETALVEDEGLTDIAAVLVAGKEKAVIENGMKKKATAKASAAEQARAREREAMDLITIDFRGHPLTIGKERHRFCEPLFEPTLLEGLAHQLFQRRTSKKEIPLSLQDATGLAVNQMDVNQRQHVWNGLVVTGDITKHVKGVNVALQSRLARCVNNSDLLSDIQTRNIHCASVPEYYAEYRETGNSLAAFLGTSIVAKIVFNDHAGINYVSKVDYTAKGPHAIIEMTPSLL